MDIPAILTYLSLFPLAAVEGPVVALFVGFLCSTGVLNPLPAYGVLLLGDLIPDTIYFYIGRLGHRTSLIHTYASKSKLFTEHFPTIELLWKRHPVKTMFFSKLAYGLSTPFLISAGMVQMNYRRFFELAFPVTILQYLILMTLGWYLGSSYILIAQKFDTAGLFIAGIALVLIVGFFYMQKRFRTILENTPNEK